MFIAEKGKFWVRKRETFLVANFFLLDKYYFFDKKKDFGRTKVLFSAGICYVPYFFGRR